MLFNVSYQNTQHCKFAIFLSTVSNWGLSDPVEDFFLLSISGDLVLSAGLLTKSGTTQLFKRPRNRRTRSAVAAAGQW